ncbi:hypothetical protein [Coleofasciculus sp. FACHB-1120]|uniref:hypothetical protein n=1 Tax=Coleofasciculus sp. FACHB-1120 TaxID=2692783 RepID=UPI001689F8E9|nr:hypothetical protein [Coleofasciculus sp. FACHB-1120]MBD2744521.1 hypothetical protein [Coleofasciculus sp. FACHB-1120]
MRIHRQPILFFSLFLTIVGTIASSKYVMALSQSSESSQTVTISQTSPSKLAQLSSTCTYDDRKTVETVKDKKGKVTLVGETYVIVTEGQDGTRYATCNLPDSFKAEGKAITFSGEVKEIYPTERWAATPLKITAIASSTSTPTPTPVQSIQSLSNGNYTFCSKPPSGTGNQQGLDLGHCYVFSKKGNRLVGNLYDTKTLGEVTACVSGAVNNKTVSGEAIEIVGDIGRQNPPPNASGTRLVNWDNQGYLKVARATVISRLNSPGRNNVRKIRYRSALLNLNGFYRHNQLKEAPKSCLSR